MTEFWKDAPIAPTLSPAPDPASPFWKPSTAIGGGVNLTQDQQREMAVELVKHGALTPEKAAEILKAQGTEPTPVDTRGEEAKAFDASFAPPPAPEAYRLDYVNRLPAGTDPNTVALFNGAATSWLHEIQMPSGVGTALVERAIDIGRHTERMTAPQLELWKREQAVAFDRVAKTPERAAQLRAYAAEVLAMQTKSPEFGNGFLKSGARFDATALMLLALHGERIALRSKMK